MRRRTRRSGRICCRSYCRNRRLGRTVPPPPGLHLICCAYRHRFLGWSGDGLPPSLLRYGRCGEKRDLTEATADGTVTSWLALGGPAVLPGRRATIFPRSLTAGSSPPGRNITIRTRITPYAA